MRFGFQQGWILPHVLLAMLWLFLVLVLPRYWKRFRVEPSDGRLLVAVAFGMPAIVIALRAAIRTQLTFPGSSESPWSVYLGWGARGAVYLTVFLVLVVYVLRAIRVADRFSFLVLWSIVISASLAALYLTLPPAAG